MMGCVRSRNSKFILTDQRVSSAHSLSPVDKASWEDAWPKNAMVKYYSSYMQTWNCATIVRYHAKWHTYDLKVLWSDNRISDVKYQKAQLLRARACEVYGISFDGGN